MFGQATYPSSPVRWRVDPSMKLELLFASEDDPWSQVTNLLSHFPTFGSCKPCGFRFPGTSSVFFSLRFGLLGCNWCLRPAPTIMIPQTCMWPPTIKSRYLLSGSDFLALIPPAHSISVIPPGVEFVREWSSNHSQSRGSGSSMRLSSTFLSGFNKFDLWELAAAALKFACLSSFQILLLWIWPFVLIRT